MKTLRQYIQEAEATPVPAAPTAPTQPAPQTYDQHAQATQAKQAAAPANTPKLVTPTAEQLKAEYKDVSNVAQGITSQGKSPEEEQQDKQKSDQAIEFYKKNIEAYKAAGNTGRANLAQKQLDRLVDYAKRSGPGTNYTGKHDPDNIGTMRPDIPFAKLVSSVRSQTGPAYSGTDGSAADAPAMSGWESIAQALAMPAGQTLFLHGDVAPSLLHKLNPWADDPAITDQVRQTLPDYNEVAKGNIGESTELDRILTLVKHRG